jgi:hypothetical protein
VRAYLKQSLKLNALFAKNFIKTNSSAGIVRVSGLTLAMKSSAEMLIAQATIT